MRVPSGSRFYVTSFEPGQKGATCLIVVATYRQPLCNPRRMSMAFFSLLAAAGTPSTSTDTNIERIFWMILSVFFFLVGTRLDRVISVIFKWIVSRTRIRRYGWLVDRATRKRTIIFIPFFCLGRFYLLVDSSSYVCVVEHHDGVRGYGKLYCATDPRNEVGRWTWSPADDDQNLIAFTSKLNNGQKVTSVLVTPT